MAIDLSLWPYATEMVLPHKAKGGHSCQCILNCWVPFLFWYVVQEIGPEYKWSGIMQRDVFILFGKRFVIVVWRGDRFYADTRGGYVLFFAAFPNQILYADTFGWRL